MEVGLGSILAVVFGVVVWFGGLFGGSGLVVDAAGWLVGWLFQDKGFH